MVATARASSPTVASEVTSPSPRSSASARATSQAKSMRPRIWSAAMRALLLHDTTGPGALRLEEIDAPQAGEGTVAIDVHAAGIGFVDYLVTRGEYQIRPPLPFVPGIEVAGTGDGRRVAATVPVGGFAEVVVAPAFLVFDLPDDLPFATGAAMVTNYQTAHLGLVRRG